MCDQGNKDRIIRNGDSRNGTAPANHEEKIFPEDTGEMKRRDKGAGGREGRKPTKRQAQIDGMIRWAEDQDKATSRLFEMAGRLIAARRNP